MDPKLFEQLLTQVSDWHIEPLVKEKVQRGPGRPSNEEIFHQDHEEEFLEKFQGINPTYPPQILKLKIKSSDCADCGKHCPEGRHLEKKQYFANRTRHWRQRCVTCGFSENPYTGKFDLNGTEASMIWNNFLRDSKQAYKSKGNEAKLNKTKHNETNEQNCIIRSWPDTKKPL
jgi:Pyruvate/2-oxoacid:ferredoxin oxidoreductase delta subunit